MGQKWEQGGKAIGIIHLTLMTGSHDGGEKWQECEYTLNAL